jgi:hypothetical protein
LYAALPIFFFAAAHLFGFRVSGALIAAALSAGLFSTYDASFDLLQSGYATFLIASALSFVTIGSFYRGLSSDRIRPLAATAVLLAALTTLNPFASVVLPVAFVAAYAVCRDGLSAKSKIAGALLIAVSIALGVTAVRQLPTVTSGQWKFDLAALNGYFLSLTWQTLERQIIRGYLFVFAVLCLADMKEKRLRALFGIALIVTVLLTCLRSDPAASAGVLSHRYLAVFVMAQILPVAALLDENLLSGSVRRIFILWILLFLVTSSPYGTIAVHYTDDSPMKTSRR